MSTLIGQFKKRSLKVSKCCRARRVVGTRIATWKPLIEAVKAALSATSVLPKPTSPQTNLSIDLLEAISLRTSSMTFA